MTYKRFNRAERTANLPDCYKKTSDSNNFKLLEVDKTVCDMLVETAEAVDGILDINSASGSTLDLYGARLGQPRGVATDEQYLLMLKAKIMRSLTAGDYNSVLNSVCLTLDCLPSEVTITEGKEMCTIDSIAFPLDIEHADMGTFQTTVQLINSLLPIGMTLNEVDFEGTFEFAANEYDYDYEKGFASSNGMSGGGYFGISLANDGENNLPIGVY